MFFRIRVLHHEHDSRDHFGTQPGTWDQLQFEGSDLASLTTAILTADLQCYREYWDRTLSDVGRRVLEITTKVLLHQQQDAPPVDWQSREAHAFCQALSGLQCEVVYIYNFLCFPLSLLKLLLANEWAKQVFLDGNTPDDFPSSSLDISCSTASLQLSPSSSLAANETTFAGELRLNVNVDRARDWTAYVSYLEQLFSNHRESSFLQGVFLHLKKSDDLSDAPSDEAQFIRAVSSIRTYSLCIHAERHFFATNKVHLRPLELEFCNLDLTLEPCFDKRMKIWTEKHSNPDWLLIAAWLQPTRRRFEPSGSRMCTLSLQPLEELDLEHFLAVFENLCTLPTWRVVISSNRGRSSSLLLVPILLKSFQWSGKEKLCSLSVSAEDWDWINDDSVMEALKANTRILGLKINANRFHPENLKKLESVLRVNHTISGLYTSEETPLTPTLKMYLELNKHGKRQLLASKGAQALSPEEWIGLLISSTSASDSTMELSCLFYFVRNYPFAYVSLFQSVTTTRTKQDTSKKRKQMDQLQTTLDRDFSKR